MPKGKKAAPKPKAKRPVGRPDSFTQATADLVCERLALGESLRSICSDAALPSMKTVLNWLGKREDFVRQYAHAREVQAEVLADQIVSIADDGGNDTYTDDKGNVVVDHDVIARSRLRVDARKWYASKLAPKKYGDKVAIGGADDLPPVQTQVHALDTATLLAIAGRAKK